MLSVFNGLLRRFFNALNDVGTLSSYIFQYIIFCVKTETRKEMPYLSLKANAADWIIWFNLFNKVVKD
jgi:hypothetical protein